MTTPRRVYNERVPAPDRPLSPVSVHSQWSFFSDATLRIGPSFDLRPLADRVAQTMLWLKLAQLKRRIARRSQQGTQVTDVSSELGLLGDLLAQQCDIRDDQSASLSTRLDPSHETGPSGTSSGSKGSVGVNSVEVQLMYGGSRKQVVDTVLLLW